MKSKSNKWLNGNTMPIFVVTIFGFTGIFFHSLQFISNTSKFFSVLGTGLMLASALVITGVFVGFLFGIPKTLSSNPDSLTDNNSGNTAITHSISYHTNTNLEQISDWLTKILVGVGLTQLVHLPTYLKSASAAMSIGLGNQDDAAIFAFAVLIYFPVCGFLLGYLWTRLLVADAFQKADTGFQDFLNSLMRTIAEIEVRIETEQNVSAKQEIQTIRRIVEQAFGAYTQDAGQVINKLEELVKNFDKMRFELVEDYKHSTKVSGVIAQARALASQANLTEREINDRIINASSDGERIVNIGLLYIVKTEKGVDYLIDLINNPRSPFEQYHAMLLAEHMAYGLNEEQRKKLENVLNNHKYLNQKQSGGRWLIKNRILNKINEKNSICTNNPVNNFDDDKDHDSGNDSS